MAVYTIPGGTLPLTSSTWAPGYVPRASLQGGLPFAESSNTTWLMRVVDGIAANIQYNWQQAGGKPAGWDDAKYGSWSAIIQRNAGGATFNAGDWNAIFRFLKENYKPTPGDWYQTHFGEYIPPQPDEYVLDPEEATRMWTYYNTVANKELERQLKLYQAEAEMIAARYKISTSAPRISSSGGGKSSVSSGGGGGGVVDGGVDPNVMAKLEMDWKIALLEAEGKMAALKQQERLALLELEYDKAYKEATLALEREKLAYQKQRDEEELKLQRAALIAKTMADPNDALQREYMLRQFNGLPPGQEPTGTPIDIFSGQVMNGGQQTTFTQLQEQNVQNSGMNPFGASGPPGVSPNPNPPAPPPTTPNSPASPPTTPQAPTFARGTQLDDNTFGFTREKFFIVGDSEDGKPTGNEELIINHDQGRVTVVPRKYFSSAVNAIKNNNVKVQGKPIAGGMRGEQIAAGASGSQMSSVGKASPEKPNLSRLSGVLAGKEFPGGIAATRAAQQAVDNANGIPFISQRPDELTDRIARTRRP